MRKFIVLTLFSLTACGGSLHPVAQVPATEVPGVQLADVVNHIKCEFLQYQRIDPNLVKFRAAGVLTFTRRETQNGDVGGGVTIPVTTGVELGGSGKRTSTTLRDQKVNWPFLTSSEVAPEDMPCGRGVVPISVVVGGRTATFDGRLLGLEGIATSYKKIPHKNPLIRPGGFHIEGTMQFQVVSEVGGTIKLYVVNVNGKKTKDTAYTVSYVVGTDYQDILKGYPDLIALEKIKKDDPPHIEKPLFALVDGVPLKGTESQLKLIIEKARSVQPLPDGDPRREKAIDLDK